MDENGAESTEEMHFFYDAQRRPAKVCFNGVLYTYVHNLQGDVVGLLDNSDNLVVEYRYDAWGGIQCIAGSMAKALGELSPFRYRGYVWDMEPGLYYLRSRYYSAVLLRFLVADRILQFKEMNVYRYCGNNGVIHSDRNGNSYVYDAIDTTKKPPRPPRVINPLKDFGVSGNTVFDNQSFELIGYKTSTYTVDSELEAKTIANAKREQKWGDSMIVACISLVGGFFTAGAVPGIVTILFFSVSILSFGSTALSKPKVSDYDEWKQYMGTYHTMSALYLRETAEGPMYYVLRETSLNGELFTQELFPMNEMVSEEELESLALAVL